MQHSIVECRHHVGLVEVSRRGAIDTDVDIDAHVDIDTHVDIDAHVDIDTHVASCKLRLVSTRARLVLDRIVSRWSGPNVARCSLTVSRSIVRASSCLPDAISRNATSLFARMVLAWWAPAEASCALGDLGLGLGLGLGFLWLYGCLTE